MKTLCQVLRISRGAVYRPQRVRAKHYCRREDAQVLERIRSVIHTRASHGHRRVTALVNRAFGCRYNRKRIQRVMRLHGLQLAPRSRRRTGRAHAGRIQRERSDERWSSDVLEIGCESGELVQMALCWTAMTGKLSLT